MYHLFDVSLAEKYGILEAIILNHLFFWIEKNRANGTNFRDGYYWTYNSTKALSKLFPYASARKIGYAIKHLIDEGLIQTGNYNEVGFDRTLWYAFTEKGESILHSCQIHFTNLSNGNVDFVKPIPDNNTDIKPDNKTDSIVLSVEKKNSRFVPPSIQEVNEYCRNRGNTINAERFVDYYQQSGWKLSNGVPMKDWKAAVRNWERQPWNEKTTAGKSGTDYKKELEGIF